MPSLLQARTSSFPRSLRPGPTSAEPGNAKRRPRRENVRTAPGDAQRAQPSRVEDVERFEARVYRLRALEVQHRGDGSLARGNP